jgi:hypothetical protein
VTVFVAISISTKHAGLNMRLVSLVSELCNSLLLLDDRLLDASSLLLPFFEFIIDLSYS